MVDYEFAVKLLKFLKILFPRWRCKETRDLMLLTACLFARTFLSIYMSGVQGKIV